MNRDAFVKRVQEMTNLPSKEMAEAGCRIVLGTLSHRLTPDERQDVADELQQELKKLWNSDTWMVNFLEISRQFQLKYRHKAELYALIQNELDKLQIPVNPEQLTTAVFHVLKEQLAAGEIKDVAAQLPNEIEQVWISA